MSEDTASGQVPFQDSRSNSSQAYLKRAASAVAEGDSVLGIHLYLAAYERALRESIMPGEEVLEGMSKAWDLAIKTKQRSLAEYIFEKLEPYWDSNEVSRHADELQRLAFDKLEEYGFDRDAIEGMADMVNQDLMEAAPDMLCRFEESAPAAAPASAPAEAAQAAAGSAQNASGSAEANQSSADANREQAVKDLISARLLRRKLSLQCLSSVSTIDRWLVLAMLSKLWENWALVARVIPSLPALSLCSMLATACLAFPDWTPCCSAALLEKIPTTSWLLQLAN